MADRYRIAADIQLPLLTAVWVLGAHLYALLIPLLLITATVHHWDYLLSVTYSPLLLLAAGGVMMAGSAFEIGQNAIDRWYLTPECGSAEGTGFCDFLFFWCIVISQALIALACLGPRAWVVALCVAGVAAYPILYLRQIAPFVPLAVLGLLAAVAAYLSFSDPLVFLQLLLAQLTMFFFNRLLLSGNQVLHGFTTLSASSGVWFLAQAIHHGAAGQPTPWWVVLVVVLVTGLTVVALRTPLAKLPATPRPD